MSRDNNPTSKQTEALMNVTKKLDKLANSMNKQQSFGGILKTSIKEHISDKAQSFKEKYATTGGILRTLIKPTYGSLASRVIDNIDERRIKQQQHKQLRKDFNENFFSNTSLGRTVDKKSKMGKELADKEFKRFQAAKAEREKQDAIIARKNEFKEKFGTGGPTKADLKKQEAAKTAELSNAIRVQSGEKAAKDFMSKKPESNKAPINDTKKTGSGSDIENKREGSTFEKDAIKYLKEISENTAPKEDDLSKKEQPKTEEKSFLSTLWDILKKGGLMAMLAGLAAKILNPFKLLGNVLKSLISKAIPLVKNVFKGGLEIAKNAGKKLLTFGADKLKQGANAIGNLASGAKRKAVELGKAGLDKAKDLAVAAKNKAVDVGKATLSKSKDVLGKAKNIAVDVGKNIATKGASLLAKSSGVVKSVLSSPITAKLATAAGGAGKFLGKLVPGVGLGLSAYDAANRYKKGDYLGAGIAGVAGAASLIPGLGTVASLGLNGLNLVRDYMNKPENETAKSMKQKLDVSEKNKKVEVSSTQNQVIAPTVNNSSSTFVTQKASVRNTEASYNRYLRTA